MATSLAPCSQSVQTILESLGSEDQALFQQERDRRIEQGLSESSLLEQLCCLHVIRARLAEGYQQALTSFQATLEGKASQRVGWRRHSLRKVKGEYESPMPWMHPFKLAGEALQPFAEELETALADGETEERDSGRLEEVLAQYDLELPLPPPFPKPRWGPGTVQVYR